MSYTGASHLNATELIVLNCVPDGEKDTANQLAALIDRKGLFGLGQELAVARCRTRQELLCERALSLRFRSPPERV
jgi:hypothetical protein